MNKRDLGLGALSALLGGLTYLNYAQSHAVKADADLTCQKLNCPSNGACGEAGTDDTKCNITCASGSVIECKVPL